MKVFYIIDKYHGPHGGTEKQLHLLIRGMTMQGHEARLFVLRHTPYTQTENDFPCPIELLPVPSLRSVLGIWRLVRFRSRIAKDSPDVIHAFFNDAAILAPIFFQHLGIRIITSRRDMGFWYTPANLMVLRLINRWADRIVCNCNAVAQHVARMERVPIRKLAVIYNGLAIAAPDADLEKAASHTSLRVCLLANLRPVKRIEDFIRAAATVHRSHPDVEFVILGEAHDDSYQAELRILASELEVDDRVLFAGRSDSPIDWLNRTDIGVLTSESEGLSNSILEYMSVGLPVVCSNAGGNAELVENGKNGYVYRNGDFASLAKSIQLLCSSPSLRQQLGRESRRRANEFTLRRMLEQYLALYRGTFDAALHRELA